MNFKMFKRVFLKIFTALFFISFTVFPVEAQEVSTPGKPGFLTAISGDREIKFTWAHPASNGGSMITEWELKMDSGSTTESYFLLGSGTALTIAGLTNSLTYEVGVRAKNSAGFGPFSDPIQTASYSTLLPPEALEAELNLQEVKLQWGKPIENGTPVLGYKIERWDYNRDSSNFFGPTEVIQMLTVESHTFTDLTLGKKYEFRIYAIGPSGPGGVSTVQVELDATVADTTTTTTTTTTTIAPPVPCTTVPDQIEIDDDSTPDNENQEIEETPEIDVRIPPKPIYVC